MILMSMLEGMAIDLIVDMERCVHAINLEGKMLLEF